MPLKKYNELVKREQQLQSDMKNLIINAVEKEGGRIKYAPSEKNDDEDSYKPLEDIYPIITRLYGRKCDYNVAITDVYLDKSEHEKFYIYADGIDTEENDEKTCFQIYPEHYSDILYFIFHPIKNRLQEYAEKRAIKDLVDKFGILPFEIYTESGSIKPDYNDIYTEKIIHYQEKLEELYMKCSNTSTDKSDINSEIMDFVTELADLALIEDKQKPIEDLVDDNEDGTGTIFKEEVQDTFNRLYDDIEGMLWDTLKFDGI